jgi:Spy/CpxP family protein refolding chaperone
VSNRVRLKGYLALALVFVLGVVVGGAVAHAYGKRRMIDRFRAEAPQFEQRHRERALVRKLHLDDAQAAKLHAVMERHGERLRELGKQTLEQCGEPLRAHQEQMDAEIRALLTPQQRERFERLLQRRKERGFLPPPGPPPH